MNAITFDLKPVDKYDIASSRFFGVMAMSRRWMDDFDFYIDEIFLAQFDLEEIHPFDLDNRLPESGFLIFLYSKVDNIIRIRHTTTVPDVFEDLNDHFNFDLGLNKTYQVCNLRAVEEKGAVGVEGMKLLGKPTTKPADKIEAKEQLLLQIDNLVLPNKLFQKEFAYVKLEDIPDDLDDVEADVYFACKSRSVLSKNKQ